MESTINSTQAYTNLQTLYNQAEEKIRREATYTGQIIFTTFVSSNNGDVSINKISFTIRTGYAVTNETEVTGRDFWDCVAEFVRRLNFVERQSNLQLGPPTIDANPTQGANS